MRQLAALCCALFWAAGQASAQDITTKPVTVTMRGHTVRVVVQSTGDANERVFVDGKDIGGDGGLLQPDVHGPYEFPGFSVLLVGFYSGGNGCEALYKAVIITDVPKLSGEIGSCYEVAGVTRNASSVTFAFPGIGDGNSQILFTASAAGVKETDIPTHLIGADYTPGMDLGALVVGLDTADLFEMKAPSQALMQVVGNAVYQKLLMGELAFPFVAVGPYVVGVLGGPQMAYAGDAYLVFDHAGHLWVRVEDDPNPLTWYGNPPAGAVAAVKTYESISN